MSGNPDLRPLQCVIEMNTLSRSNQSDASRSRSLRLAVPSRHHSDSFRHSFDIIPIWRRDTLPEPAQQARKSPTRPFRGVRAVLDGQIRPDRLGRRERGQDLLANSLGDCRAFLGGEGAAVGGVCPGHFKPLIAWPAAKTASRPARESDHDRVERPLSVLQPAPFHADDVRGVHERPVG